MGMTRPLRSRAPVFVACLVAFSSLLVPSGLTRTDLQAPGLDLIGVFGGDVPISGAVLKGDHLYVTSAQRLSIFDVGSPVTPTLVGSALSPNPIHGELLPTNGELLLLNDGFGGETLDVWNVEDKSNPVLISTVSGVGDEHWSCVLSCTWAYGSTGSIIDLRHPAMPEKVNVDWQKVTGTADEGAVHRVDEYRPGYVVSAPREEGPAVIDATDPLRPRIAARSAFPVGRSSGIVYSTWPLGGHARYLLAAVERQESDDCSDKMAGMLLSFDTKRDGKRSQFAFAGRLETESFGCDGAGFYVQPHPDFDRNGLLALPYIDGVMVVRLDERGRMSELASFHPLVGLIWHAFWATDEVVYALNRTGEIYILRYT